MLLIAFRRWLGHTAPAVLLLCTSLARGQEPAPKPDTRGASPLELTWVSPDASCDGASVAARAVELVATGVAPRSTQARATVGRDGDHWTVDLETRSESHIGRRALRGESCKEIQQAIALLLAMIMESEAKAEAAAPAAPPALGGAIPPVINLNTGSGAPEIDDAPATPRVHEREPGFGFAIRTEGTVAIGSQPGLGLGAGGSVGAAFGPFELHAAGALWPARPVAIFEREGTFEMSRNVLGLAACVRIWEGGPIQLVPCLGPELMWLKWHTTGLRVNRGNGTADHVLGLGASLELRVQLVGPMFAALTPGLTWQEPRPYTAHPCQDCTATQFFQTWPVGLRLGAGVGARF